jgi:membrane protein implicated in regulation of membrane protease activity
MMNFDQVRIDYGKQPGPLAKILAVAAGLVLFGASLFLGFVFLFAAILFVGVVAIVARFRSPANAVNPEAATTQRRSVLEGEYVVVESKRASINSDGEA